MRRVLITGATGNAGREVVREAIEAGLQVRAGVRRPEGDAHGAHEAVAFDFVDRSTWTRAVADCQAVFLLRPPPISNVAETLNPFIDRARDGGVDQVVFLSVAGAEKNSLVPHAGVEKHLMGGDGAYTILRPGFFAQNLQDAYLEDIRRGDRIFVPAGRGRVAFVDLRDVAAVAVKAMAEPDAHAREAYTLTGPEAVDFEHVAMVLSEALGRRIRYRPASIPGYMAHLRRRRMPWGQVLVQTTLHALLRMGNAASVDPTLASLLDRPPRTIAEYVHDHVHLW